MNVQTETSQDKDKSLVYNHDEAKALATVITTFNKHVECIVDKHWQQHVVTYSLKAGINKFGDQAKASAHKEMKQLHDRSCSGQPINTHLISSRDTEQWNHFCSQQKKGTK